MKIKESKLRKIIRDEILEIKLGIRDDQKPLQRKLRRDAKAALPNIKWKATKYLSDAHVYVDFAIGQENYEARLYLYLGEQSKYEATVNVAEISTESLARVQGDNLKQVVNDALDQASKNFVIERKRKKDLEQQWEIGDVPDLDLAFNVDSLMTGERGN